MLLSIALPGQGLQPALSISLTLRRKMLPPTQQQLWNFLRLQQRKPQRLFLYETDGVHIPDFLFAKMSGV